MRFFFSPILSLFLFCSILPAADYVAFKTQVDQLRKQYAEGQLDRAGYERSVRVRLEKLTPEDANVALLKKDFWNSRTKEDSEDSDFVRRVAALADASRASFRSTQADQQRMKKILSGREFAVVERSNLLEMLIQRFLNWLVRFFGRMPEPDLNFISHFILTVALVGLVALLAYFIYRSTRSAPSAAQFPDIEMVAEEIHLREPEFYQHLAEEALNRGEYRLALRYYFYSILSVLHRANLIPFEPSRTNREYWVAFQSAQQDRSDVQKLRDSINTYETYWYGNHAASPETVTNFRATTEFFLQKYR
jgi:hypothetical protein